MWVVSENLSYKWDLCLGSKISQSQKISEKENTYWTICSGGKYDLEFHSILKPSFKI